MNSHVLQIDHRISIYLTTNKHRLQSLLLCFVLHMQNRIKYKLYNNWSAQAVNSVLYEIQRNQSNLLTFKLANQSTLNKVHVIEITKACIAAFMKARNSLVVWCREKQKQKMVKMYFLKCLVTIKKVFMADLHEKVIICYIIMLYY